MIFEKMTIPFTQWRDKTTEPFCDIDLMYLIHIRAQKILQLNLLLSNYFTDVLQTLWRIFVYLSSLFIARPSS